MIFSLSELRCFWLIFSWSSRNIINAVLWVRGTSTFHLPKVPLSFHSFLFFRSDTVWVFIFEAGTFKTHEQKIDQNLLSFFLFFFFTLSNYWHWNEPTDHWSSLWTWEAKKKQKLKENWSKQAAPVLLFFTQWLMFWTRIL